MKKKRFKNDINKVIVGMLFDDAKTYCLSEGYQLQDINGKKSSLSETYLITVTKYGDDGRILETKYGK